MSWINDVRVAYKFVILNLISILGMIIIGVLGYTTIKQAQKDLDTVNETYLNGIFEIGRCRHAMRYAQVQTTLAP